MTKTVTRYCMRATCNGSHDIDSTYWTEVDVDEDSEGEWVRYDDIKHLLADEPSANMKETAAGWLRFPLPVGERFHFFGVDLTRDEAKQARDALTDWLKPDEPNAPQKVIVLVGDYGYEGHSVEGVYASKAAAEAARDACDWAVEEWRLEEYEVVDCSERTNGDV